MRSAGGSEGPPSLRHWPKDRGTRSRAKTRPTPPDESEVAPRGASRRERAADVLSAMSGARDRPPGRRARARRSTAGGVPSDLPAPSGRGRRPGATPRARTRGGPRSRGNPPRCGRARSEKLGLGEARTAREAPPCGRDPRGGSRAHHVRAKPSKEKHKRGEGDLNPRAGVTPRPDLRTGANPSSGPAAFPLSHPRRGWASIGEDHPRPQLRRRPHCSGGTRPPALGLRTASRRATGAAGGGRCPSPRRWRPRA